MLKIEKRLCFLNKKGVSPLIATILLILFVVFVASIVIFWGRTFVKERADKEGVLAEKKLKCESIEFNVKSYDKAKKEIIVENIGADSIDGFVMRVVSGGEGADQVIQRIDSLKTASLVSQKLSLGTNAKVDLIPALRPEGINAPLVPCSNKHKVVKLE